MYRGHDPERIKEYATRDLMLYLELEPVLDVRTSLGGFRE